MQLDSDELFMMVLNALQFHVSTAKILKDPTQVPNGEIETDPYANSPLGPAVSGPEVPPEILALLLEELAGGGAMGMATAPPDGYAVGPALPPFPTGPGALPGLPLGVEGGVAAA